MLKVADRNDISGAYFAGISEGGADKIDSVGGSAGKDDFFCRTGIEVTGNELACVLVSCGSFLSEMVSSSVDIGVEPLVVMATDFEDDFRFLRGSCIVEIHQRLSMNLMLEDRKTRAYCTDVVAAH